MYRTYPIRVAGNSGPLNRETTWEQIGVAPEQTTVTKKTRRVGEWDSQLANQAMEANGGPAPQVHAALTGFDYLYPELTGKTNPLEMTETHHQHIRQLENDIGTDIEIIGTSPNTVIDRR